MSSKTKKKQQKKKKTKKKKEHPKYSESQSKEIRLEKLIVETKYQSHETKSKEDIHYGELITIGDNFVTILLILWEYICSFGRLCEISSVTSVASLFALINEIRKKEEKLKKQRGNKPFAILNLNLYGKDKNGKEHHDSFKLSIFDLHHLQKINEFKRHNRVALKILHETALQELVNNWEKLLSDLFGWYLKDHPEKIDSSRTLKACKLLQFDNIDEIKTKIINDEIKSFITTKDTKEQLKFFKNNLGVDLQAQFEKINDLIEIILRRHLIVHAGSIVTGEYINKVKKLKLSKTIDLKVGDHILIEPDYVSKAWEIIYAAGVIFLHCVGKKLFQYSTVEESIDNFLNNAAFLCIKNQLYNTALTILEYGKRRHFSKESQKWTLIINLAQTYKWLGQPEKMKETIDGIDWKVANPLYQLCLAALNDDSVHFRTHLNNAITQGLITVTEL